MLLFIFQMLQIFETFNNACIDEQFFFLAPIFSWLICESPKWLSCIVWRITSMHECAYMKPLSLPTQRTQKVLIKMYLMQMIQPQVKLVSLRSLRTRKSDFLHYQPAAAPEMSPKTGISARKLRRASVTLIQPSSTAPQLWLIKTVELIAPCCVTSRTNWVIAIQIVINMS